MLTFACTCVTKLMLRGVYEWGGVGWGMLTFACTCVTKLMLCGRCGMGWGMLTFACTCVTKLMLRGRCGVGHVNVRLHLRHEVDASW